VQEVGGAVDSLSKSSRGTLTRTHLIRFKQRICGQLENLYGITNL